MRTQYTEHQHTEFIKLVLEGVRIKDAALELQIRLGTAYHWHKLFLHPPKWWDSVDWSKQNIEIADKVGVSRSEVGRRRKFSGHPHFDKYQGVVPTKFRKYLRRNRPNVRHGDVQALAKRFGLSDGTIRKHLNKLGLRRQCLYLKINKENLKSFCTVDPQTECWEINGIPCTNGYPRFGRRRLARHVIYEWFNSSPRPRGLMLSTTCPNRKCVNPGHLCFKTRSELRQAENEARKTLGLL